MRAEDRAALLRDRYGDLHAKVEYSHVGQRMRDDPKYRSEMFKSLSSYFSELSDTVAAKWHETFQPERIGLFDAGALLVGGTNMLAEAAKVSKEEVEAKTREILAQWSRVGDDWKEHDIQAMQEGLQGFMNESPALVARMHQSVREKMSRVHESGVDAVAQIENIFRNLTVGETNMKMQDALVVSLRCRLLDCVVKYHRVKTEAELQKLPRSKSQFNRLKESVEIDHMRWCCLCQAYDVSKEIKATRLETFDKTRQFAKTNGFYVLDANKYFKIDRFFMAARGAWRGQKWSDNIEVVDRFKRWMDPGTRDFSFNGVDFCISRVEEDGYAFNESLCQARADIDIESLKFLDPLDEEFYGGEEPEVYRIPKNLYRIVWADTDNQALWCCLPLFDGEYHSYSYRTIDGTLDYDTLTQIDINTDQKLWDNETSAIYNAVHKPREDATRGDSREEALERMEEQAQDFKRCMDNVGEKRVIVRAQGLMPLEFNFSYDNKPRLGSDTNSIAQLWLEFNVNSYMWKMLTKLFIPDNIADKHIKIKREFLPSVKNGRVSLTKKQRDKSAVIEMLDQKLQDIGLRCSDEIRVLSTDEISAIPGVLAELGEDPAPEIFETMGLGDRWTYIGSDGLKESISSREYHNVTKVHPRAVEALEKVIRTKPPEDDGNLYSIDDEVNLTPKDGEPHVDFGMQKGYPVGPGAKKNYVEIERSGTMHYFAASGTVLGPETARQRFTQYFQKARLNPNGVALQFNFDNMDNKGQHPTMHTVVQTIIETLCENQMKLNMAKINTKAVSQRLGGPTKDGRKSYIRSYNLLIEDAKKDVNLPQQLKDRHIEFD